MPTRKQYVEFLKSLEGGYGPARGLANNDNQFNTWYYGRRVSGDAYAWCLVFECYAQNHFGILAANGGKAAYVPNMKARAQRAGAKVVTRPNSTAGMKPGDALAYDFNRSGEPEHTGTFVSAISSTEFYSVEGNTSTSKYSDAVALKRRSVHDVLWHIELLGVDDNTPMEDDVPEYVSLGMKNPQKVKAGQAAHAIFDVEYGDAGDAHADGAYPGILSGGPHKTQFVATIEVPAAAGSWRLIETDPKKNYAVSKTYPLRTGPFTETGKVEPDQHLYVELHPAADGAVNVAVKATYWKLPG